MPGPQELLVIAVVALLVFGPDRLPEMMRTAARLLARFREQSQRSIDELKRAAELDDVNRELRGLRRQVSDTASAMDREVKGASARLSAGTGAPEADPADPAGSGPPPMDPEAT